MKSAKSTVKYLCDLCAMRQNANAKTVGHIDRPPRRVNCERIDWRRVFRAGAGSAMMGEAKELCMAVVLRSHKGSGRVTVGIPAAVLLALVVCVGCAAEQGQSSNEIAQSRAAGAAVAEIDWKCKDAGIYVFRQVAAGERDRVSGLPLRDGGTDAVAPARAAWVSGYNLAIQRHRATEGSPHTVQWTGRLPWNGRYGIRVATATPDGEIVAAKIVEYAADGSLASVPQTAFTATGSIEINFDEYSGNAIGPAKYAIGRALINRNGHVYVEVSGREVEVR